MPEVVRRRAQLAGAEGEAWLAALPAVVDELERAWSLGVAETFGGGTAAFVARVVVRGGSEAVLKVCSPGTPYATQVAALDVAGGRGYTRLLAADAGHRAMLLELVGPPVTASAPSPPAALRALARTLRVAWRPLDELDGLPDPRPYDKATELASLVAELWQGSAGACPVRVYDAAMRCAQRRAAAFDPEACVFVHGDAAAANLLRVPRRRPGAESGFVFVDPDGFVGDPANDLGVAWRDWGTHLLAAADPRAEARRWCRQLAADGGCDEQAVWDWGYLERVSTGLVVLSLAGPGAAAPFLESAALLTP